jgi:hypothetical protein
MMERMRKNFLGRAAALIGFGFAVTVANAQSWTTITNQPPNSLTFCMLLTNGSVMCQGTSFSDWYKLSPDVSGSYLYGTWSTLASLPAGYAPDAYASAVLVDGRVVIVGGEYNGANNFALTNMGAIYDPAANTWTMITPPANGQFQCIGDAPAAVLADGRLIIGSMLYQSMAILNPTTLSWTVVSSSGKNDSFNAQEGWTLLPDGSIFTLDVANAPAAERFLLTGSTTGVWVSSGSSLQDLHVPSTSGPIAAPGCPAYTPPGEMGPAVLRPNGTVFAIGADGFTGVYTPPPTQSIAAGSWAVGPALPAGLNVQSGPAALLPSGHVLFGGSPGASGLGLQYFEFDGSILISVPAPARASADATNFTSLLVLPTGQAMFTDSSTTVQIYTAASSPSYNSAWAPTIASVPPTIVASDTYQITGTQLNGLSQGSAYGDANQNATNYPLVKITNVASGHVLFAKTHTHSTMGVATGTSPVYTYFDVPANIEGGSSSLQVIANGIPSATATVNVIQNSPVTIATMTSPANNTRFSGSAVTFQWTTGSVIQAYYLYIGTSPLNNNLYAQYQGQNTSVTVTGLPTNGETIYVTLYSLTPTGYQDNQYTYTALTGSSATPVLDFNGSGYQSVFLYDPVGGTGYAGLGNGSGAFTYVYNAFTPGFDTIRYGNFTNSNYSGLLAYNSQTALGYALLGNGSGTFSPVSLFWGPGFNRVAAGDLNGDGLTDFVIYRTTDGTTYTAISNGDGTFHYQYTLVSIGFSHMVVGDFNGDGKADVFFYRSTDGLAYLGISNGTGGFTFSPVTVGPGYAFVESGDINGDGKADLLFYSGASGATAVGLSTGSNFTFTGYSYSPGFTSVKLFDFNGDGKADVAFYNMNNTLGYLGVSNGTGNFTFSSLFWGGGMTTVDALDLNNDGKIDIVIYNSANGASYTGISSGNAASPFTYQYSYWGNGKVLATTAAQP